MTDPLRLRLLEREVELMCHFALIVAEELENAARTGDTEEMPILAQALIATSLKISHLLWPFGRRVTDQISVDEAGVIRKRMALDGKFALVPANIVPLVPCLTMTPDDLVAAIDANARIIRVDGEAYPVEPLIEAIAEVKDAVVQGA